MKFLDPDDPFFGKMWVRVLTVALPLGWAIVEFAVLQDPLWGMLFLAAAAYAGWQLFFKRKSD
ncbi:hypothetical protein [Tabrizicola sp. BL-A-41-H6]|uniref:hypothetical protein n=1 Tax=Tabrizicola sp. BL-A-41-H6 TaxID=3421107 RepID=UPI003D6743D7